MSMSWLIFVLACLVAALPAAKPVSPLIILLGFIAALMIVRAEWRHA